VAGPVAVNCVSVSPGIFTSPVPDARVPFLAAECEVVHTQGSPPRDKIPVASKVKRKLAYERNGSDYDRFCGRLGRCAMNISGRLQLTSYTRHTVRRALSVMTGLAIAVLFPTSPLAQDFT
jgi:hypothetical protein